MISKKLPQSLCEMRFGISGLNNSSLVENFYPEDLPEDWRFSYYSNEFKVLLIGLLDLNRPCASLQNSKTITPNEVIEALVPFRDELEPDFVLLFDTTKLSDNTRNFLADSQQKAADNCYFINSNNINEEARSACAIKNECIVSFVTSHSSQHTSTEKSADSLLCIVANEQQIAAIELRKLLQQIRAYAISQHYLSVNILFSAERHALENCRNAILLESMM